MDLDADGHRDILSGSYSRMQNDMAGLFQVLHGKADGTFGPAEVLNGTDGKPLIIPLKDRGMTENICTRPFAIDWDGDKDLDLVVGTFAGTLYLFKGQAKGKFDPVPEEITASGQPLKFDGYHSDPFVIDWDGDGDLDVLSGSATGGVQWAENAAGPGKTPHLKVFRTLIEHGRPHVYGEILREEDLKGPSGNTRIWVDDINSDGKLDILVGDSAALLAPLKGVSEPEFKQRFADWNKSIAEASKVLNATDPAPEKQAEARARYQKVYNQRGEFMTEDSTGFVWLYLQK